MGKMLLNIKQKDVLSNEEILNIEKEFNEIFLDIELKIKIVDDIPKGTNGKFRYLIQNIKNEMFNI